MAFISRAVFTIDRFGSFLFFFLFGSYLSRMDVRWIPLPVGVSRFTPRQRRFYDSRALWMVVIFVRFS